MSSGAFEFLEQLEGSGRDMKGVGCDGMMESKVETQSRSKILFYTAERGNFVVYIRFLHGKEEDSVSTRGPQSALVENASLLGGA